MNSKVDLFNKNALEYDHWYDENQFAYQSELEAIKQFIPEHGLGLEIGAGTGRFSVPFNISIGVEPSKEMSRIASSRGITIHNATAEDLPFCKEHFDFVLMINTICFVGDPIKSLKEVNRILTKEGKLILAILDRDTALGQLYDSMKSKNKFYNEAEFYSTKEILEMLKEAGFRSFEICQTILSDPKSLNSIDKIKNGYGEGLFVVINSLKE